MEYPNRNKNLDYWYLFNKYRPKTQNFVVFFYSMDEKFNKNAKVEQLIKMLLSLEEEKDLIVKDPLKCNEVPWIFNIFIKIIFFIDNIGSYDSGLVQIGI